MSLDLKKTPIPEGMEKRNKYVLTCTGIIEVILIIAYILEVIKGDRELSYVLTFGAMMLVPLIACVIYYFKDPKSIWIRWIVASGYFIGWIYLYATGKNYMIMVYIIPMLLAMLMYNEIKVTLTNSVMSFVAVTVLSIYNYTKVGMNSAEYLQQMEIAIAGVVLIAIFAVFVIKINNEIQGKKDADIKKNTDKQAELLSTVSKTVDNLNTSMDAAVNFGAETINHTDALKNAMADVAKGAGEMATSVQDQMTLMGKVQTEVDASSKKTDEVDEKFTEVRKSVGASIEKMDGIIRENQKTTAALSDTATSMDELIAKVENVHKLLDVINEIQSQTSLLSLNASIEAARAGEAGRGFAVVANEISSLSTQTEKSSTEITELLNALSTQATSTKDNMENLAKMVKANSEDITEINKEFADIMTGTEAVKGALDEQKNLSEGIRTKSATVASSIESLSAFSEELLSTVESTNAEANTAADDTKKVINNIEDMRAASKDMANSLLK